MIKSLILAMRSQVKALITSSLFLLHGVALAQSTWPNLVLYPRNIQPGEAATITASIIISNPHYIVGSAILNELSNDSNRVVRKRATFVDDGTEGDEIAGDKIYTARFVLQETSEKTIRLAASIAFRGVIIRATSVPTSVFITKDADINSNLAIVETNRIVFRSRDGSIVNSIPIATNREERVVMQSGEAIETASDFAFVAGSQQRVGIITQRTIRTQLADEGSNSLSSFQYLDATGQVLFSFESNIGHRYLFVDPQMRYQSHSGHRVLIIDVGDNESEPTVFLFDEYGLVLYYFHWADTEPGLLSLREAQLSSSGRHIALLGQGLADDQLVSIAIVIDVDTGLTIKRVFTTSIDEPVNVEEDLSGFFRLIIGQSVGEVLR